MKTDELIMALQKLKVQTGSLACLGCGHEHNCGVHGCALIREAVTKLIEQNGWINPKERLPERGLPECPMETEYPWIDADSDGFCNQGVKKKGEEHNNND